MQNFDDYVTAVARTISDGQTEIRIEKALGNALTEEQYTLIIRGQEPTQPTCDKDEFYKWMKGNKVLLNAYATIFLESPEYLKECQRRGCDEHQMRDIWNEWIKMHE